MLIWKLTTHVTLIYELLLHYFVIRRPSQVFCFVSFRSLSRCLHHNWWFSEICETRRFSLINHAASWQYRTTINYQPSPRIEITFWENAIIRIRRIISSFVLHFSHDVQESHRCARLTFCKSTSKSLLSTCTWQIKQFHRIKSMFYENGSCWRVNDFSRFICYSAVQLEQWKKKRCFNCKNSYSKNIYWLIYNCY